MVTPLPIFSCSNRSIILNTCTTPSGFALTLDGEEFEAPKEQASWFQRQRVDLLLGMYGIGHVREYPIMHCFGIPDSVNYTIYNID